MPSLESGPIEAYCTPKQGWTGRSRVYHRQSNYSDPALHAITPAPVNRDESR